jgi:O-antigen/teichoic acid export membrane protein
MGAISKTFTRNLVLLIGINLLIKPFYLLFIEARVQERIGAEEYGIYFALLNLSFILNIVPDLGITNWNNRRIAQQGTIVQEEVKKIIRLRLVLGIIYLLICLLAASSLGYNEHQRYLLCILAFNQVLSTGILFLRSYLNGMHLFNKDRFVSVVDRLLLIVLLGSALSYLPDHQPFPADYLVYAQTVAYGLTLLLAAIFVWPLGKQDQMKESLQEKSILVSSLPFAALILISMMSNRIDGILLERISGSYEAGIYALAFRLSDMLTMISYLFAVLLLPIFSRMLANHEKTDELFGTAFRLLLCGCTLVTILCTLQAEWILQLIYKGDIHTAASILPWTMAAASFFSLQYATGTLLTAAGKLRQLITVAIAALLCNSAINGWLIPSHAALGASIAAFCTQALVFIIQIFLTHKGFGVWKASLFWQSIGFMLIAWSMAILINTFEIEQITKIILLSISVGSSAVLFKMIPIRNLGHRFHIP